MKVLLINVDSNKLPNIALHKIATYYQLVHDAEIIWNNEFEKDDANLIYVSCIYSKNRKLAERWEGIADDIGGSGYDIKKKLPPEIEKIKPKIGIGFTTRGCIRNCGFCIVPEKEGKIHIVNDLYDIWDGKSKNVILLDNNILALKHHFMKICAQANLEKIDVDFNQGLDIRLITDEIACYIKNSRIPTLRFALDHINLIPVFKEKMKILRKYYPVNSRAFIVYMIAGYDSTFEEDRERVEYLKSENCRPYVMRYEKVYNEYRYIKLAQWANQPRLLMKYTFDEYVRLKEHGISNVESLAENLFEDPE